MQLNNAIKVLMQFTVNPDIKAKKYCCEDL